MSPTGNSLRVGTGPRSESRGHTFLPLPSSVPIPAPLSLLLGFEAPLSGQDTLHSPGRVSPCSSTPLPTMERAVGALSQA